MMPRIIALLALGAWGLLLYPYLGTVFTAGAAACLTLPVYRWLRARMGRIGSVACFSSLLCLILIIPVTVVSILVTPQALNGIRSFNRWRESGWSISPELTARITAIEDWLNSLPLVNTWMKELSDNIDSIVNTAARSVVSGGIGFAGSTVTWLWLICLFIILTSLGVVYAPTLRHLTLRITNLPTDSFDRFIVAIRNAVRAVVLGLVLVALVQGTLCGIGFTLTGVSEPAFWGLLAIFVAIIPVVGTALVWVPMAISLWVQGSTGGALFLVAWGMLVVAGADNLLRPYFLKTGIQASMFVLLLSILCAMAVFGAVGLIAGPVLVAFAIQARKESDALAERQAH